MSKVIQPDHRIPGQRDECRQYVKNVYTRSMRMRTKHVEATWPVPEMLRGKLFKEIY